ncbi:hypothetical protein [Methylotuvimicrobium sp. KM2]|uniref:hypothetical protein n=1 Tax=Methylotuvimicrobium sp. KM2 TaxID=3133976 RepID=UPI00310113AD
MACPYSDRLRCYREEIMFALEVGEGLTLRQARDRIAKMPLSGNEQIELIDIDLMVVDSVVGLDWIASYLLSDDDTQALSLWWWHLGKIRAKTFPAEQLPEPLRAVYLDTQIT